MGATGPQSDPKNDPKITKNPIPDSPWPPVGPRGHSLWMLAPFLHHFRAKKQATGHTVGQHVSKKLFKITYFKNNSKMSLIFWLLPPTPLPEKPNDLLRTSCLSPEPPLHRHTSPYSRGRRQRASALRIRRTRLREQGRVQGPSTILRFSTFRYSIS